MDRYIQMMADMNVFRSDMDVEKALSGLQGFEDALRLGIQFEKDSIIFYLTMHDATDKKKGRDSIDQLVEEEKKHLKKLVLELRKHAPRKETIDSASG